MVILPYITSATEINIFWWVIYTSASKLCFQVVVVSDRVYEGLERDVSGELALALLVNKGYCVEPKITIRNLHRDILKALRTSRARVVLLLGGTGPSPRDITVDIVESVAWRCLPGFGEHFRRVSYEQIGVPALLTRASLCILHDGKIAVVLPGSPNAVSIGIDILSQLVEHLVEEVDRFETPHRTPGRE